MKSLYFCLLFLCSSIPLFGQTLPKSIKAQKIATSDIVLDGQFNESFWEQNEGSSGFLMQEPVEGGSPTEKTVIKIAYDDNNLYIGAIFYDSDPSGIKSFQKRRDASLSTDDRFMWILDTYLDGGG